MRSLGIVPVATVGLLLCLSPDVSANVFRMQSRNAPSNGNAAGTTTNNANTRVNRNNRNNRNNPRNGNKNKPTHELYQGPEKVRAMRRHYKFPLLKRAQGNESRFHAKGVGVKWKDVVLSDSSAKDLNNPAAKPVANGAQVEKKERPARPKRNPNKPIKNDDAEATKSTDQTNVFTSVEEPKPEIEEELAALQEQHASELMNVMDISSTFVPPSTEVFTAASQTQQQQQRRTQMIVSGVIALTGVAGLASIFVRRTLFPKVELRNTISANMPIRMIDEDGDPIDLGTHYGIASIGASRSSAETRASIGFHL
jgi:hypothetical protein